MLEMESNSLAISLAVVEYSPDVLMVPSPYNFFSVVCYFRTYMNKGIHLAVADFDTIVCALKNPSAPLLKLLVGLAGVTEPASLDTWRISSR